MRDNGFVMPTVLAFIIIASSLILFQSIALISELYGIQAQISDIKKLGVLVNTRRAINDIEINDECSKQTVLSYEDYELTSNCVYLATNNQKYNSIVKRVLSDDVISETFFMEIETYIDQMTSITDNDNVTITINNNQIETDYSAKLTILSLKIGPLAKVIVVDDTNLIKVNTNVK